MDENALLEALQSGHVAGAGLDVFLEEPPKNTALVQHPKVVCTPHLGASTKEAQNNVAKEIALQFLDIIDGKAVPGVVNAPLLSEMLKHENLIWTILGRDLGKLAVSSAPNAKSLKVIVTGKLATASVKLIKESVLVGALSVLTTSPVNVISAAGIAENLSIASSYEVQAAERCCHSTVTVETELGTSIKVVAQGRRAYLVSYNGDLFEPLVALEGNLTLFQTKDKQAAVLTQLLQSNQDSVVSTTRAKSSADRVPLYAVHSTSKLNLEGLNVASITSVQF